MADTCTKVEGVAHSWDFFFVIRYLLVQMRTGALDLDYYLFYKSCQDHLEHFFSAVRIRNGWCFAPTSRQFRGAFRQLLIHATPLTRNTNCSQLDETSILKLQPDEQEKSDESDDPIEAILPYLSLPHYKTGCRDPECLVCQATISYIGGYIARSAAKKIDCQECLTNIEQHEKDPCPSRSLIIMKSYTPSLATFNNYDGKKGLTIPSGSVVKLLKRGEKFLRSNPFSWSMPNYVKRVSNAILSSISPEIIFPLMKNH